MKKVLAAIVEYKLNNKRLPDLTYKITSTLEDPNETGYPTEFKAKMHTALKELQALSNQVSYNHKTIMGVLEEIESLIVDYLSNLYAT